MKNFSFVDHTADIGLFVRGISLPDLYVNAARGMFCLLFATTQFWHQKIPDLLVTKKIKLTALTNEDLLVTWLNELLYLFLTAKIIPIKIRCRIVDTAKKENQYGLITQLQVSKYVPNKFGRVVHEIKAATYHRLSIKSRMNSTGKKYYFTKIFFDV